MILADVFLLDSHGLILNALVFTTIGGSDQPMLRCAIRIAYVHAPIGRPSCGGLDQS